MAAFAKRARLNSQPGYAAQIDGGNPLAAGLVAAINPATYRPSVGQVSYTHAPVGVGINGTGSSYLRQEIPALGSAATILFIGNVLADAAPFAGVSGPGGTQLFCFQFITPSNGLRALLRTVNGGGVSTAEFAAPWNSGTGVESNDVLVAVYDGTNQLQVYGNGVNATASRNSTAADGALSGFTAAGLGGLDRATDSFAAAGQRGFLLLVWNRALSASEVAEISANPWQVFTPRRVLLPVAGGGPVTHATTGALTNAGATLAGSAAVVRVHGTSGTLANAGAVIAASAARTRTHPTSGALANSGAVVVGSAARAGGATTHATTGVLAGSGSAIAGTAARRALHITTGALTAGGAFIAGSAARVAAPVTHATSGSLAGQGALIVGIAAGPAVPVVEQVLAIPRFGLRVKTGELFALVLDAGNVPIAYRRSNGGLVSIRLINTTTRSAAINDQGDIIQII